MSPQQLYDQAEGEGVMSLVIPRVSTGEKIRLAGRSGPLGTILTGDDKRTVAHFDRAAVRRFLKKNFPQSIE
jgi:hypothetical protein